MIDLFSQHAFLENVASSPPQVLARYAMAVPPIWMDAASSSKKGLLGFRPQRGPLTLSPEHVPPDQWSWAPSGYHCSLFANYTLDGIKAVLLFSMTSTTGGPCAQWDSHASRALSHPAFQPFTWPVMFDTSATYVDVKVFNGNEVLFHWVFRGYRSDADLSVQQQFCDEVLIRTACDGWFRPSIVISVFVGCKGPFAEKLQYTGSKPVPQRVFFEQGFNPFGILRMFLGIGPGLSSSSVVSSSTRVTMFRAPHRLQLIASCLMRVDSLHLRMRNTVLFGEMMTGECHHLLSGL